MKISIITVSFNSSATIEETLRSVHDQSYNDVEHIVVDGDSKDGTRTILNKYRNGLSALIIEPDYGIYDAMNKGIRSAKGDIIGFLNADDCYVSNKVLEKVVQAFREHDTDSVYGDLCYVAEHDTNEVIRFWKAGKCTKK
ncbi:MAG TPA: glycosyltransferase, partial [Bacteroidetes bacterium]|nr:glycosyltransferase [Bacteroidota bacterium]